MADLFGRYRILYTHTHSLSIKHYCSLFSRIRAKRRAAFHCYRQGDPMLFFPTKAEVTLVWYPRWPLFNRKGGGL